MPTTPEPNGGEELNSRKRLSNVWGLIGLLGLCMSMVALAQEPLVDYTGENHQIRRDKFDMVLPEIMRERNVDMWIHVMREAVPDSFGTDELGSSSGVFVFTDRGGDRIERAVLGRRWGAAHRGWGEGDYRLVEESGAYDIVAPAVRIQEPVGGVLTEYDYRFEGLGEFVAERDPQIIAVNFKHELGPWVTYRGDVDGLSHTDFVLLSEELGEPYASRLISSEWLVLNYINRQVPSEIELLKSMRQDELARVEQALAAVEPGVTRMGDTELTIFRRMWTGESQRGRSDAWSEDTVVQGGDILSAPRQGVYAYVLREGEDRAAAGNTEALGPVPAGRQNPRGNGSGRPYAARDHERLRTAVRRSRHHPPGRPAAHGRCEE